MPAFSLTTPGVYRQDIFPTARPDLPTGVPVFLGWAAQRPKRAWHRLTLWTEFEQRFGQYPAGHLASAVHGFFSNGGQICYVVCLSGTLPKSNPDELAATDALKEALEAIASLDEIDLVCFPDLIAGEWSSNSIQRLQTLILEHCDCLGDRFALLDAPQSATVPELLAQAQQLSRTNGGSNGALYAPWVLTEHGDWVPPCGHVAGMVARSDRQAGVHRAPANLIVEDVLNLSTVFSATEQEQLSAPGDQGASVNYLRILPGRGIRAWGARTLSRAPNGRYINVRRLLITVARWVERNLTDVAFEPNDFRLWLRIERDLTAYLETLARQGALQGTVPQEAFYVKCNAETNPPEVRDIGQVITEIGLAPTQPNEFIVVRLIHGEAGVTLSR
jgi:uncharacterized protein